MRKFLFYSAGKENDTSCRHTHTQCMPKDFLNACVCVFVCGFCLPCVPGDCPEAAGQTHLRQGYQEGQCPRSRSGLLLQTTLWTHVLLWQRCSQWHSVSWCVCFHMYMQVQIVTSGRKESLLNRETQRIMDALLAWPAEGPKM